MDKEMLAEIKRYVWMRIIWYVIKDDVYYNLLDDIKKSIESTYNVRLSIRTDSIDIDNLKRVDASWEFKRLSFNGLFPNYKNTN